jgi:hypothetical protein
MSRKKILTALRRVFSLKKPHQKNTKVISKKVYLGYDVVDWLESWVFSVPSRRETPTKKVLTDLGQAENIKPLRPMTLYRGFNQRDSKTLEMYMKKFFGGVVKVGDTVAIQDKEYSSWTKDIKIAKDFASKELIGGQINRKYDGLVVSAVIQPKDMLVEISKVQGLDTALSKDIREEKEIIVNPGTFKGVVVSILKWK